MRRPSGPAIATFAVVFAVIAVVIWQVDPSLLLANTMTTGGDTGAHFGLLEVGPPAARPPDGLVPGRL